MPTLNYLAVLVAAVLAFLLGGLWYSPAVFGRAWVRGHGLTEEQVKEMRKRAGLHYAIVALLLLLMAYATGRLLFHWHVASGVATGISLALLIWLGFVLTTALMGVLLGGRRLAGVAIDLGYQLACLLIMGIVLAAWR